MNGTRIYEQNAEAWVGGKRRILNEGGTSSSKTYSILQLLILIAQHTRRNLLISVVSESLPHLRKGTITDFFNILDESQDNNPNWSKTEHTYTFGKGKIEFFGADDSAKVRGPRRDILFINEGNNVAWEAARGLDIRTSICTFVDWNPVGEFWAHQYESGGTVVPGWIHNPENKYIHSTYLDAIDVLPPGKVADIEAYRDTDPNWWNVYGLGKLGKVEGLVYPLFTLVDELPGSGDTFAGLDFGFTSDPAAVVKNVIRGRELYSRELVYERNLTNADLSERMEAAGLVKGYDEIFADSAEPKSIEELYRMGWNIKGAPKGPGSVDYRHQKVRQYKQYWTKDSLNCIKEQRNFRYIADKNGKLTDKTTHTFSHGMDARDYGVVGKLEPVEEESVIIYDAMQEVRGLEL